jgi:two-component system CheB/CheR fusion protein
VGTASDLLLFSTEAGGLALSMSEACRVFFGLADDAPAPTWAELVHPDDLAAYLGAWQAGFERRVPFTAEARMRRGHGGGTWCWLEACVRPRLGAEGAIVAMEGFLQDVSGRHAAVDAQSEAVRRKDEFLAVLSHELRNPLAPIRSSLYVLEHTAGDSPAALQARQVIGRQVTQLSHLVDDLLDATRVATGKIRLQHERLELGALVSRCVADHGEIFRQARIHLHTTSADEVWIDGDSTRLLQVIGNLLGNAVKFTPPGGSVRIEVSRDHDRALIELQDTGSGMSAEERARIFEPFAQGSHERCQEGLGLGLWLVRELVQLHGGEIGLVSELGQGTTVALRLPLARDQARGSLTSIPASTLLRRRRILIIEDNLDAAESLQAALELLDHDVAVAHDGTEGLARAHDFQPDVVFCDIGLPGMSGYEVARSLKADVALRNTILVALTGYAQPEDRERARDSGFTHHVAKPSCLEDLAQLLAESDPNHDDS